LQRNLRTALLVISSGLLFATVPAMAQPTPSSAAQSYPNKSIRMIIPYGAGGATDVVLRIVASRLPELLGQQVVIDNRTGAGGLIGTEAVANAVADGYTLLGTGTPHVIYPHLYKKIQFNALEDFAPIMQIGRQPYGLTVHPSLSVRSVKELIAQARKHPGKINYASSGNGGAQHLFQALFVSMANIDMVHIPYKGSGQVRADLLGGQVEISCLGISSVINNHKAGQLRIIAVTSAKRSPELPDIPSIAETVPGYDAQLWIGLLAPRATPAAAVNRLEQDVTKLLQQPDVKTAFERVGTYIEATNPRDFGAHLKVEFAKWGKVVRDIKLQVN
jgi:tripartite-type tricarboxylate transporter receptor subunit TctC